MIGRREQQHTASGTNEWKTRWLERKERRRRMATLAIKIERAWLRRKRLNGVVGKPTTKRVSLLWAYGKHPKTMR